MIYRRFDFPIKFKILSYETWAKIRSRLYTLWTSSTTVYYFGTHADKNSVTHKTGGATTFRNRDVIWLRFKGA